MVHWRKIKQCCSKRKEIKYSFDSVNEELWKIPVSEELEVSAAVTAACVELTEGRVGIAHRQIVQSTVG